jgi:peptidoglycan/LPS O-acetylase OafA/YrhL
MKPALLARGDGPPLHFPGRQPPEPPAPAHPLARRGHAFGAPRLALRKLGARIEAATPAGRDRSVDALRGLAIAGVILGHWLVTALVLTRSPSGDRLHDASPLASLPALAPASWIFQTLAIFFFVGGYAAARSRHTGGGYLAWLRGRLSRLSRPVAVLAAVWVPLTAAMALGGVSPGTIRTLVTLVLDPLWFLGVFAGLTALTPLAEALVRRCGAAAALIPAAGVAAVDLARFGLGAPGWIGWVNVGAGWLVPYLLGVAWARGALRGWKVPAVMLAAGGAGTAVLVIWAGYPASMVGVNGAAISNLNPPTLAAVTFGVAQVGLALLLRPQLARLMRRPLAWAAVALVNLSAMTLFLWHQSAFLAVTMAGAMAGRLPGLLTPPSGAVWIAERLAWLPAFAATLAAAWLLFHRFERPRAGRRRAGQPRAGPSPVGPPGGELSPRPPSAAPAGSRAHPTARPAGGCQTW